MSAPKLVLSGLTSRPPAAEEEVPIEPALNTEEVGSYHQNYDFALGHYTLSCKYNGPEEGFIFPYNPDDEFTPLAEVSSPLRAAITNSNEMKYAALSIGRIYRETFDMDLQAYRLDANVTCFQLENGLIVSSNDILPKHLTLESVLRIQKYRWFVIMQTEWSGKASAPYMTSFMIQQNSTKSLRHYVKPVDEFRPFASLFRFQEEKMRFPKAISVGQVRLKKTLRELDERGDRAPYRVATIGYQSEWGVKDAMRHYETLPDSIKAAIPPPSQENFMRSASDALGLSPGHIFAEAKQPKVCPKLPDSVFLQISTFVTTGCAGSPVLAVDMGEKAIAVGLVIGGSQKENHNVAISFNDPGIVQMLERNGFSGRSA